MFYCIFTAPADPSSTVFAAAAATCSTQALINRLWGRRPDTTCQTQLATIHNVEEDSQVYLLRSVLDLFI